MTPAALPVQAPSSNVDLSKLFTTRLDVELETTSRLRELRNVEVHVDGVLPFEMCRFRSLAHGSGITVGQFEITLGTFRCCSMALNAATSPAITRSNSVFTALT